MKEHLNSEKSLTALQPRMVVLTLEPSLCTIGIAPPPLRRPALHPLPETVHHRNLSEIPRASAVSFVSFWLSNFTRHAVQYGIIAVFNKIYCIDSLMSPTLRRPEISYPLIIIQTINIHNSTLPVWLWLTLSLQTMFMIQCFILIANLATQIHCIYHRMIHAYGLKLMLRKINPRKKYTTRNWTSNLKQTLLQNNDFKNLTQILELRHDSKPLAD